MNRNSHSRLGSEQRRPSPREHVVDFDSYNTTNSVDNNLEAIFRQHRNKIDAFCSSDGTKFNFGKRKDKNRESDKNNSKQQISASKDVAVSNLSDNIQSLSKGRHVLEVVEEIKTGSNEDGSFPRPSCIEKAEWKALMICADQVRVEKYSQDFKGSKALIEQSPYCA